MICKHHNKYVEMYNYTPAAICRAWAGEALQDYQAEAADRCDMCVSVVYVYV